MRLKIAARQSDLARLQAYQVAEALQKAHKDLKIEFQFRASLGDLNQTDPLWKMPERGVFTEDFVTDLITGRCDMVVHSWKDLPTQPRKETKIVATLPRADLRDVILVRKDRLAGFQQAQSNGQKVSNLRVLTSSPRRAYNLDPFLREYLPFGTQNIEFASVRGNIPTRLKKLVTEDADALVVAKAAIDRLLSASNPEFAETQKQMRAVLDACEFMVLPLSLNPTAAAQGALAIEIKSDRADLVTTLKAIHCDKTYRAVELEREILSGYGGGCHQKIGVSVVAREYGEVLYLRGLTDSGEILNHARLAQLVSRPEDPNEIKPSKAQLWPQDPQQSTFFSREPVTIDPSVLTHKDLVWVSRENAWPEGLEIKGKIIWSAGIQTWKKLAARGIWVHGSAESLGEAEAPGLEILTGKSELRSIKLTHAGAPETAPMANLATYRLVAKASAPEVAQQMTGKTHFYWMSGSSFDEAIRHQPSIQKLNHACGPGHTYTHLRKTLGPDAKIQIFLSFDDWKSSLTKEP